MSLVSEFGCIKEPFTREFHADERYQLGFLDLEVNRLREVLIAQHSAALIGPAGVGKSVVLRTLTEQLSQVRFKVTYLKMASLGVRDMCRQLAQGLGLQPRGTIPYLMATFEAHFKNGLEENGVRHVVIIDDAQELRVESFRLVRMLTNYQMDSKLLVSVILAGHHELKEKLSISALEDIRQRISYCGEIRLLNREEARSYMQHRMRIAGSIAFPFNEEAVEVICEISRGNMRAIDKICRASLRTAQERATKTVTAAEVAAARSSQWL
jgi:type II secretory pathway predicted ATPase ExeA